MSNKNHRSIKLHFKKIDPVIYKFMVDLDFSNWLKPLVKKRIEHVYFAALCRAIVGQQLSGKAARTIHSRFQELFPKKQVNPKKALKLKDQKLRDAGLSWGKVSYIKDLAHKHLSREVKLNNLRDLTNEEVIEELTKVKGIGPWTSEMFLMFTLGRENVFSFGDLGLKKGIEKLYKLKSPTQKQIEKIIKPWTPYKTYGSITLWQSLE